MRELKFIVNGQLLSRDPECDFSGIVPGSEDYIKAKFSFSKEWDKCVKVVEFTSGIHEYPPKVISELNTCLIPYEALKRPIFNIRVLGQKDTLKLKTNKVSVKQEGGNK